jgi:hypothetical protein
MSISTLFGSTDSKGIDPKPVTSEQSKLIAEATAEVRSGRGGARPGAGRKPNSPRLAGAPPLAPGKPQEPVSPADIEFCRTITEAALKIIDRIETNSIVALVNSIGDAQISEKCDVFLRQREISEADRELMANAVGACAAKYTFLSRYAPEGAIVLWSATHAMAYLNTVGELKKLGQIVAKKRLATIKAEKAPDASPPQAN